jgi:hypothetical protein
MNSAAAADQDARLQAIIHLGSVQPVHGLGSSFGIQGRMRR